MKLSVSSGFTPLSNNNKKIPTQSSQPFLLFTGLSLTAGILRFLYIHIFNIVLIICELELKDYTYISYYLRTIIFPEWRSYIDLPTSPLNYSNCIAKHCSSKNTLVLDVWDFNSNQLHFYQQNHTCGQREMLCVGFCSAQNIHSLAKKADYKKVSKWDPCCHLRSNFSQQPRCSGWAVKSIHSPAAGSAKCFSETTCCSAMWSQPSSKEDCAAPQKASYKPVSWFRIKPLQQGLARPVCSIPVTGPWSSGKGLGTATFHHPPRSSGGPSAQCRQLESQAFPQPHSRLRTRTFAVSWGGCGDLLPYDQTCQRRFFSRRQTRSTAADVHHTSSQLAFTHQIPRNRPVPSKYELLLNIPNNQY